MAFDGQTILCVVPARGGSKSIPKKNLSKVCGISLVGHAGLTLEKLDWIDAKVLSTDDAEIAEEGVRYGLATPFTRPNELSTDHASSLDMWRHAWSASEKSYRMTFDISLLIEPTSPLRLPEDLERALFCVVREGCPAAVTVSRTPAHYTPHKTLSIDSSGSLIYFMGSEGLKFHNRHSIPEFYHRNGVCYAVTRKYLMEDGLILEGARPVVIERPVVNIDDMLELEMANWLMERQGKMER